MKLDAVEPLLLSEGVCRQLGTIPYHPSVLSDRRQDRQASCDADRDIDSSEKNEDRATPVQGRSQGYEMTYQMENQETTRTKTSTSSRDEAMTSDAGTRSDAASSSRRVRMSSLEEAAATTGSQHSRSVMARDRRIEEEERTETDNDRLLRGGQGHNLTVWITADGALVKSTRQGKARTHNDRMADRCGSQPELTQMEEVPHQQQEDDGEGCTVPIINVCLLLSVQLLPRESKSNLMVSHPVNLYYWNINLNLKGPQVEDAVVKPTQD